MVKQPFHITVLGGGNVGTHLAKVFLKTPDVILSQFYNRHINAISEFSERTEIINDLSKLKPADIFILALKDDIIGEFSRKLKNFDVLIVHTSGSLPMSELQTTRKGVFYPFQTFSKTKKEMDFSQIPVLIEATGKNDLQLLKTLAQKISNNVIEVNSEQRKALHVAGVFAANFVNLMYAEAEKILKDNNLPFDLLKPLILEVAQKVQTLTPREAQTGPAVRGDLKILQSHLKLLKEPWHKEIYQLLSDRIYKNS